MRDLILLKPGELMLKGQNRHFFEDRLRSNLARRLKEIGRFQISSVQSMIYVEPLDDDADLDAAVDCCSRIFGIVSVCRAAACEKDRDAILAAAIRYLEPRLRSAKSFKVESKRSDKRFPMTSIQLSQFVGGEIADRWPSLRADMHDPELVIHIEVREAAAYIHAGGVPGAGGLPVGTCGRAVSLLSGGIDSPVSTYMIARRGVQIIPVHFFSFPYTSELAKEKVVKLAEKLLPWCGRLSLEVVPFTHIQEEIRDKCPEEFFTVIMRRFMMRIAESIALDNGCGALVTGENLGQVASQTMEAIRCTEAPLTLPVLRPLIGFDKEQIIGIARKLDTFETSILPYEDCCTVFTPRHPRTKPPLEEVVAAESVLDVEALCREALDNRERIAIHGA